MSRITEADRRRVILLLLAAAVGAIGFVVIYMVMVRTAWGQRTDDSAVAGRVFGSVRLREGSGRVLSTISVGSLTVAGLLLMGVALARRRVRLALGAGLLVFGSVILAELFKNVVLPRPHLIVEPATWMPNIYPSGHTTIATSLGLALVMVTPQRRRPLAGVIGFVYATAMGAGVLAAGWHRPSDPMGAICLVFSIACVIAAGLIWWRGGVDLPDHRRGSELWIRLLVCGLVGVLPVVVVARTLVGHHPQLVWSRVGRHFAAATASIGAMCLVAFVAYVLLLRDVTLDHPDAEGGDGTGSDFAGAGVDSGHGGTAELASSDAGPTIPSR